MRSISALIAFLATGTLAAAGAAPGTSAAPDFAPAWYERHKVHLHTRLGVGHYEPSLPAAMLARELGAAVMVRHVKSAAASVVLGGPDSILLPMVSDARAADVRLVAYYWLPTDDDFLRDHPDLVCLDASANEAAHKRRGTNIDVTAPTYLQHAGARLALLQDEGADGFYIDWRHLPPRGCFGTQLERSFRAMHPEFANLSTDDPAFWRHFQPYQAQRMAKALDHLAAPFRGDASFAPINSVTSVPALMSKEMRFDMARVAIPKTEYNSAIKPGVNGKLFLRHDDLAAIAPADATRMAMGFRFLGELAGVPPHVWIHGQDTGERITRSIGAVIAHGAIANLDVAEERLLGEVDDALNDAIKQAFALGDRAGQALNGLEPQASVAILVSEDARDKRSLRDAWEEVVGPATYAFERLLAHAVPTTVVDDRIMTEGYLGAFDVILVPNPDELTPEQRRNLERFPETRAQAISGMVEDEQLREVITEVKDAQHVRVEGLPQGAHAVLWSDERDERHLLAVVDDFTDTAVKGKASPLPHSDFSTVRIQFSNSDEPACGEDLLTGTVGTPGSLPIFQNWALIELRPCN